MVRLLSPRPGTSSRRKAAAAACQARQCLMPRMPRRHAAAYFLHLAALYTEPILPPRHEATARISHALGCYRHLYVIAPRRLSHRAIRRHASATSYFHDITRRYAYASSPLLQMEYLSLPRHAATPTPCHAYASFAGTYYALIRSQHIDTASPRHADISRLAADRPRFHADIGRFSHIYFRQLPPCDRLQD